MEANIKVCQCIQKYSANKQCLVDTQMKLEQIALDSIAFIQVIIELEEIFNFEFEDEMLAYESYESVADIVNYIESRCEKGV